MKKKKLVKKAFQCPDKYTTAELSYMKMWLKEKERQKELKKSNRKEYEITDFNNYLL